MCERLEWTSTASVSNKTPDRFRSNSILSELMTHFRPLPLLPPAPTRKPLRVAMAIATAMLFLAQQGVLLVIFLRKLSDFNMFLWRICFLHFQTGNRSE